MNGMSPLRAMAHAMVPAGLRARLAVWRDRARAALFRPYNTQRQFGDHRFTVRIADPTGRRWYDHDWPWPDEIVLLREKGRLRPGALVFDIGAHQGVVAMLLARSVAPGGRVVAAEPVPHNASVARENVRLNALTQSIEVLEAAVGAEPGVLRFMERDNGQMAGDLHGNPVPVVTLDAITEEHGAPAVVFVDVEGFEAHVLKGGARTLHGFRPDLYIEVHSGGLGLERFSSVDELLSLLPEGYQCFVSAVGGAFRPLSDPGARALLDHHSLLVALDRRAA